MRIFLVILMVLFSYQAAHGADRPEWLKAALKKDNLNELAYYAEVDDECPLGQEQAKDIVDGVLTRSRIKPIPNMWTSELYLSVVVNCIELDGNNPVFSFQIYFANRRPVPVLFDSGFGGIGVGGKEFIESRFKNYIEVATAAYLKANFDLGD